MPLNNAAMVLLANSLRTTVLYAQLHEGLAGVAGMNNIAVAGRELISWATPGAGGNFGLISQIDFTGGTPNGPVYSFTLWNQETGGTFYGEHPLGADLEFNTDGEYAVTQVDITWTVL